MLCDQFPVCTTSIRAPDTNDNFDLRYSSGSGILHLFLTDTNKTSHLSVNLFYSIEPIDFQTFTLLPTDLLIYFKVLNL